MEETPLTPDASPANIKTSLPINSSTIKPTIELLTKELSQSKLILQLNFLELNDLYKNISFFRDTLQRDRLDCSSKSDKNGDKGKGKAKPLEEVIGIDSGVNPNSNNQILLPLTYISTPLPKAKEILNLTGLETSLEIWEIYLTLSDKIEPTNFTSTSSEGGDNSNYKLIRGAILNIALLQPLNSRIRIVSDRMILDEITSYMNWLIFGSLESTNLNDEVELLELERGFDIKKYLIRNDEIDGFSKDMDRYCNIEGKPKNFEVVELNDALTFLKIDENCSVEELVMAIKISQIENSTSPLYSNGSILTVTLSQVNQQPYREFIESILLEEIKLYFNRLKFSEGIETEDFLELYTSTVGLKSITIADIDTDEDAFEILGLLDEDRRDVVDVIRVWYESNSTNYLSNGSIFQLSRQEKYNEDLLPIMRNILLNELSSYLKILSSEKAPLPSPLPLPSRITNSIIEELKELSKYGGYLTKIRLSTEINEKKFEIVQIKNKLANMATISGSSSISTPIIKASNRSTTTTTTNHSNKLSISQLQLETFKKKIIILQSSISNLEKTLINLKEEIKKKKTKKEREDKIKLKKKKFDIVVEKKYNSIETQTDPEIIPKKLTKIPLDIKSSRIVPKIKLLAEQLNILTTKTGNSTLSLLFKSSMVKLMIVASKVKTVGDLNYRIDIAGRID